MFDGWMAYGGQEIFNGPRTKAYLQHLQPTLSLGTDCCDCDTLAEALGDERYSSPAQDDAAWFNPYAAETGGFYGLIPLAVEGFENSTWQVPLTELMGDGSVSGRGRRGGRDLRFRMLAAADSEKAMSRGLAWLSDALGSDNCATGDCGGAQVCYLTDCPGCCAEDAPEALEDLEHLDYREMSVADATAAATADWTATVPPTAFVTTGQTFAYWPGRNNEISRTIDGFVPGATYRIALDFGGAWETSVVTVSIPGAAELLTPREVDSAFLFSPSPAGGTAVWEFIATECTHRIVITGQQDLAVGMLDVSLTNLEALAYSGQPSASPSQAGAWTATLFNNAAFKVTEPYDGEWRTTAATNTLMAALTGEIILLVPDVVAGHTYRVTLLATMDDSTGMKPGVVRVRDEKILPNGTLAQASLASIALPTDALAFGLHGGWVTFEFTAGANRTILAVSNLTNITVGPSNTAITTIRSAMIEEVDPVAVLPDPHRNLRRYLRDVVLTSGPTITTVYPSYTAVLKEVEWTMRANVPDPLGEDILVTSSLGPTRIAVPETVCSLGEAVRTNYIPNPSGEYGVLNWGVPDFTVTNPTSTTPGSGTKVIRLTRASAGGADGVSVNLGAAAATRSGFTWTFSGSARSSKQGRQVTLTVDFLIGGSVVRSVAKNVTLSDSTTDWQDVVVTATVPPSAAGAAISYQAYITLWQGSAGAWTAGEWIEFDKMILETAPGQRAFFDGDSQFGRWLGTPGNSASVYQRTAPAAIYDPECPPTPAAPRPPDIVNDCLTTPTAWIRYVLSIPALATAQSPRGAPTITIATGAVSVRGLRVRVYANPFNRAIENIDPCSFCGEFLVSYMPEWASLTVDAADKTASITTSGGSQNALHLLYGSDGGPITWPMLGCAMPYLVVIDVDDNSTPLIDAAVSVTPIF